MGELLDALEGLGCLVEMVVALFRGVATLVAWILSPFRRARALPPSATPRGVRYGGRKRP